MWPYPWTHVGTPSHLGHMDRVAATVPSQAHAGAAQEAPDIGQWEGQDVPLVRPSSCNVKGGIPSSRRYLPTYLCPRSSIPLALVCWSLMLWCAWYPRGYTVRFPYLHEPDFGSENFVGPFCPISFDHILIGLKKILRQAVLVQTPGDGESKKKKFAFAPRTATHLLRCMHA